MRWGLGGGGKGWDGGPSIIFENASFTCQYEIIEEISKLFLLEGLGVHLQLKLREIQKYSKMKL